MRAAQQLGRPCTTRQEWQEHSGKCEAIRRFPRQPPQHLRGADARRTYVSLQSPPPCSPTLIPHPLCYLSVRVSHRSVPVSSGMPVSAFSLKRQLSPLASSAADQ